ncbi:hypothetical protein O181_102885 [Austropuccinia psidii MF-1]|uniref:Uncharacterized protein n=1 Tax=Austropuccinia psidii MF-1 TaxID=1389203 RepID=A0A9Q3JKF5_9BASI|nr:hypothetical protein [Austropuccinia psidii MF-1]
MVTSLLDQSKVIIKLMARGHSSLGRLSPMGFKHQTKTKPTKSLVPSFPCEQTPQQPTPGPSGTQGFEDLFCRKHPKFHLISTFNSIELTLPPFVEPSPTNEPPIPGPSPSSKPYEDIPTCEPEPEVAPMQSMEDPFVPSSDIPPIAPENPTASPTQSHNEACQEFTDLQLTLMIPQAIVHKSIN